MTYSTVHVLAAALLSETPSKLFTHMCVCHQAV